MMKRIVIGAVVTVAGLSALASPDEARRAECAARADALVRQMSGEERIGQLMMASPAIDRLGIPRYHWWNEALHGDARAGLATVFPQSIGMAACCRWTFRGSRASPSLVPGLSTRCAWSATTAVSRMRR